MKAIIVDHAGVMHWADAPDPVCGRREVVVKISATAVNRADLLQRRGLYMPPAGATHLMGLECAGEVVAVGAEHGRWQVGDRVCALLPGGGYAQYVNVPHSVLMPLPDGMSFEQAASLPEVFATAYLNLFTEARLAKGETCLVHAGASGVGTAAIQLARYAGAQVFATAGHSDKAELCRALGAVETVNYREEDFCERVMQYTNKRGVDVVLDTVGASYLSKNIQLMRYRGRLVVIGLLGGVRSEIDLGLLLIKNIVLRGSTLRNRSTAEKARLARALVARVWPLFASGELCPVIDSVDSILNIANVHKRMECNETAGKIVLQIPHDMPPPRA